MPRRTKKSDLPFWWRKERTSGCYYVQVDRRQVRLSPDLDEAWRLYHELMAAPPEERRITTRPVASDGPLVIEVLDSFLDWLRTHREPGTFRAYKQRLEHFAKSLKADGIARTLTVSQFKPYH